MLSEVFQREVINHTPGSLLILTGPTSAGKTDVQSHLIRRHPEMKRLVTATTRNARKGEVDGIDYYFLSNEEFQRRLKAGNFLSSKKYGDSYYGITKIAINPVFNAGSFITSLDISGAANFAENVLRAYSPEQAKALLERTQVIFIGVSSLLILKERATVRGSPRDEFRRRIQEDWAMWKQYSDKFPNVFINNNGQIDAAVSEVEASMANPQNNLNRRIYPTVTMTEKEHLSRKVTVHDESGQSLKAQSDLKGQEKGIDSTFFELIRNMVDSGVLDIKLILSPPRTGSTLMETSFSKSPIIDVRIHEPFIVLRKGIEEDGYKMIFDEIKPMVDSADPSRQIHIVIKEMSHWLEINNGYERFFQLVESPPNLSYQESIIKY